MAVDDIAGKKNQSIHGGKHFRRQGADGKWIFDSS